MRRSPGRRSRPWPRGPAPTSSRCARSASARSPNESANRSRISANSSAHLGCHSTITGLAIGASSHPGSCVAFISRSEARRSDADRSGAEGAGLGARGAPRGPRRRGRRRLRRRGAPRLQRRHERRGSAPGRRGHALPDRVDRQDLHRHRDHAPSRARQDRPGRTGPHLRPRAEAEGRAGRARRDRAAAPEPHRRLGRRPVRGHRRGCGRARPLRREHGEHRAGHAARRDGLLQQRVARARRARPREGHRADVRAGRSGSCSWSRSGWTGASSSRRRS